MKRAKAREVEKRATENTRFTSWSLPSIKAHSELIDKLLPSSQPHDMSNFFLVNNTIIQVQGNINHIDCSQTTILTDCFNVVTATGPSSDQPSPSGLLIFCPCLENITEIELSWLDLSSNDSDSMPFSGTVHVVNGHFTRGPYKLINQTQYRKILCAQTYHRIVRYAIRKHV